MIQIIITADERGQVQVSGPLQQKAICLGIIELAKSAILNQKESNIVIPDLNTISKLDS